MSTKAERRAARAAVAAYHEAQLTVLVERVGAEIDRYRAGQLDAFDIDGILLRYSRAAKELWKFCNLVNVEIAAKVVGDQPPDDWWERGAPRNR